MSQAEISVPTASGKLLLTWVTLGWRNGVSKGCVRARRCKLGRVLHVVEHNAFEVALGLRGAVERDELLRLDCEGERWAARERGVALRGKRQRFEARVLQIDLSASGVGDHVPLAFWRHS